LAPPRAEPHRDPGVLLFVASLAVGLTAWGLRSEVLWAMPIIAFLVGDALMIFGGK
jgi:hypothetical protein